MLGMLLTAPLILAWSRAGLPRRRCELTRDALPELLVLYVGPHRHHQLRVRRRARRAPGFIPPLAYLCAPFLIWAALRFGLRAATLGLAIFGLICYWHTGHGLRRRSPIDGIADLRSLLHLQGYLATIVVTTLFSAALLVERAGGGARDRGVAQPPRGA